MVQIFIFGLAIVVEIFALLNRGGGPLLSHLFLMGAVFLAVSALVVFDRRGNFGAKISAPAVCYILFFLFFVLSFFVSKTPEFGLSEFLLFLNAGIFLLIFSGLAVSENALRRFSIALIALAVLDTLAGFFLYTRYAFPRLAGTFLDLAAPYSSFGNDYADFVVLILPLALWQMLQKHRRRSTTLLSLFAVAILAAGFILSFSRGAWISFGLVLALAVVWIFLKKRADVSSNIDWAVLFQRCFVAILITIALVVGLQNTRSKKFETTSVWKKITFQADEGAASSSERLAFWKGAVQMIKENPLFGTGIESFKYLYPRYQAEFGTNWDHPHNVLLKIGVENGLTAAVFFMLFLLAVAGAALKFLWRNPWHPILPFMLGALGAFGHNLADFNFIVSNFILFIIFVGLGLHFSSPSQENAVDTDSATALPRGLFIISFLALLLSIHEGFYNIDFKTGRERLKDSDYSFQAPALLENAQKLFFKRDLANYLVASYNENYERGKNPRLREKEKTLLLHEVPQAVDAALVNRLGELYEKEGNYRDAEAQFAKSLELDPANRFRYYYNFAFAQQKLRLRMLPDVRAKIIVLLNQYTAQLADNSHFTILTDNPEYASKLYGLFGMKKERDELDKIWLGELIKFSMKYGKPSHTLTPL